MLLFDVTPLATSWCFIERGRRVEGEALVAEDVFPSVERRLGSLRNAGPTGFVLYHGGELIVEPVSFVRPDSIPAIRKCSRFLPEYNDALANVLSLAETAMPDAPRILLCNTAFFHDLPEYVHTYAVPSALSEPSLRRYGGSGLCHEWVWESLQFGSPVPPARIISVYLGENTNVAAIDGGKPMETSLGFTPVEGLSTAHGCGDIDPTVVFQIQSTGLSFNEISQILVRRSGFSGYLGRECSIAEIVRDAGRNSELAVALDIYSYQIKKYIGACAAVLGGVDAVAFVTEDMETYGDFIRTQAAPLGFLGARIAPAEAAPQGFRLTAGDSPVEVRGLLYDKWKALSARASDFLKRRTPEK
jgi:acetate kinase